MMISIRMPTCIATGAIGVLIALHAGCDPAADATNVCKQELSSLGALCPVGTVPTLSTQAAGSCNGSTYTPDDDAGTEVGGTCESNGSCTIACIVSGQTCPCGIASISKQAITCKADCPAGCGNGACDPGETNQTCPGDCTPSGGTTSSSSGGGASSGGGSTSSGGTSGGGSGTGDGGAAGDGGSGSAAPTSSTDDSVCSSAIDGGSGVSALVYSDDFETNALSGVSGTWSVDNSMAQAGSLAIHPGTQMAGTSSEMSITCGDTPHSEMSFYYDGYKPTAGQHLQFYVDDVLYDTYGNTENYGPVWAKVSVVVPTGMHKYRWDATTDTAAQPPFWIDTIECHDNPVVPNTDGHVDFEEGFVPPELGGDFRVDNSLPQAGSYSARPLSMNGGTTESMYFSCGCRSSGGISFDYTGYKPTAGQHLAFYVDDVLKQTYGNTENYGPVWVNAMYILPSGVHHYRWDFSTDVTGQPPFWIDTIACQ
jgi:hypothetical protein